MFDVVVCANGEFACRLADGGVANVETLRMGVETGLFSPALRSPEVREEALRALGLGRSATLLVGIGRLASEKRWDMVLRAVAEAGRRNDIGLLLIGDGVKRPKLELMAQRIGRAAVLPRIGDRLGLARLLASADALVHGCEAETFCMVAAEARASGIPLIVPDRGAAIDQLVAGAGAIYRAASERSLEQAICRFIDHGPEFQRAAAVRASRVRTIDDHFSELFARYEMLSPRPAAQPAFSPAMTETADLALARSAMLGS